MIRLLSAVVFVHCALWVLADQSMKLSRDPKDKCRMSTGNEEAATYPVLDEQRLTGKIGLLSKKEQNFRFPKKSSKEIGTKIVFIEVKDNECYRTGADLGNFASIYSLAKDLKSVFIGFDLTKREAYSFDVKLRG